MTCPGACHKSVILYNLLYKIEQILAYISSSQTPNSPVSMDTGIICLIFYSLTALYDRVENSASQDKRKVDVKKGKIATINKQQELTESFICIWREERSLWDVIKCCKLKSVINPKGISSREPRFHRSITFLLFFLFVFFSNIIYKQRQQQQVLLQSPCLE